MFEPVHGSAPKFAGKNIANPIGAIASAALMLETLGLDDEAAAIDAAILKAVRERQVTRTSAGRSEPAKRGLHRAAVRSKVHGPTAFAVEAHEARAEHERCDPADFAISCIVPSCHRGRP